MLNTLTKHAAKAFWLLAVLALPVARVHADSPLLTDRIHIKLSGEELGKLGATDGIKITIEKKARKFAGRIINKDGDPSAEPVSETINENGEQVYTLPPGRWTVSFARADDSYFISFPDGTSFNIKPGAISLMQNVAKGSQLNFKLINKSKAHARRDCLLVSVRPDATVDDGDDD